MVPSSTPLSPEAQFNQYLAQGEFMVQRSRRSGRLFFYPRVAEPGTGATDLEWVKVTGAGTVYSTTVVHQRPPSPSYNVALVDLAEGPRMMARVEGVAPEDVRIGMALQARIVKADGQPLVVFEPVDVSHGGKKLAP